MFVHQSRLPHVLPPRAYWCEQQHRREVDYLFQPAWHLVASATELARDGDFVTLDLLGQPILVRNFAGTIQAFLNVCTHRHCLLTHEPRGRSATLKCQYHGWEYLSDGTTSKIPDARSFRPLPGGPERLRSFPTRQQGPFIFVSLDQNSLPLEEQLGPLVNVCDEFDAARWRLADAWSYDFAANWKVPVENTIESYHVPIVHPTTLVDFTPEEQTEHELHENATVMRSRSIVPWVYRRLADWLLPVLEPDCTHRFRLHHGFPSLFLIRIDATLQAMTVVPTGPESCRLAIWLFTLRARHQTALSRWITWSFGRLKSKVVRRILAEDAWLYPDLQRGLRASPFRGTISTREELIFAFQRFVAQRCGMTTETESAVDGLVRRPA